MRKLITVNFILIISLLSLSLFSCASTKTEDSETPPTIEITQEPESQEQATDNIENNDVGKQEAEPEFPLPLEIKEPEIVTLEPEDIPVEIVEPEKEPEEPEVEEELIIVEEPLPIVTDVEKKQEEKTPEDKNIENNKTVEEKSEQEKTADTKDKSEAEIIAPETTNKQEEAKPEEKTSDADDQEDVVVAEEPEKEPVIVPSRSVTLKVKEYLDVTYPGSGWIFMGQTDGARDLTYFGRGLGTKDTTFTLQARKPGTKILHFYKNDHLTNEYLDDYIEVIVLDQIGSNKTHIVAPPYKQPVPEKAKEMYYKTEEAEIKNNQVSKTENKDLEKDADAGPSASPVKSETDNTEKNVLKEENHNIPDQNTLLKEAQLLYNEEEFKVALEKIELFLTVATKNIDQGLYLKGQILEAKSEVRDIKNAIASYSKLTKEYPASKYWDSANKRIVYLKRFYLEVR